MLLRAFTGRCTEIQPICRFSSMAEKFAQLLTDFALNPVRSAKEIREIADEQGEGLFHYSLALLKSAEDNRGFRYLLELLLARKLILTPLYDPALFNMEEALRLAKILQQLDSLLGLSLVNDALESAINASPEQVEACGLRLVELLEETFEGLEILQAKAVLLRHPNPRVRSKASALFARRMERKGWAKWLETEPDYRVRANAIEALWGEKREWVKDVFLRAAKDENNRVAGNALIGLHLMGEPESVELLVGLASHPNFWFRATAAWAMGRTGDARFRETLVELLRQPGPVAKNALRALRLIHRTQQMPITDESPAGTMPVQLDSPIVQAESGDGIAP